MSEQVRRIDVDITDDTTRDLDNHRLKLMRKKRKITHRCYGALIAIVSAIIYYESSSLLVRCQLPLQTQISVKPQNTAASIIPIQSSPQPIPGRGARTADVFQNGDGYNIFVTNTCERESMKVNIRTGRPFYGVIHTRNQRNKPLCTIEGNGDTDYNLEINHVLQPTDPLYCGVTRSQKKSSEDKESLSVVVAFRVHRNIELSDDKFFLLNCTK